MYLGHRAQESTGLSDVGQEDEDDNDGDTHSQLSDDLVVCVVQNVLGDREKVRRPDSHVQTAQHDAQFDCTT